MKTTRKSLRLVISGFSELENKKFVRLFTNNSAETEFNYELKFSDNFADSKELFHQYHPDLYLIDVKQDFSFELCTYVRESEGNRHTGIIFSHSKNQEIGSADSEKLVECLDIGADDFIRVQSSSKELVARTKAVLRLKVMTDELRSVNHKLEILSMTDELTGLANMRHFSKELDSTLSSRSHNNIGILMFDLDHFKSVNDNTNHLIGSFVISEIGNIMKNSNIMGEHDLAARYGGDEFICFLHIKDEDDLMKKGDKLRELIGSHSFSKDGSELQITASIGLSYCSHTDTYGSEDMIKAADYMLYKSKYLGRNCVHLVNMNHFDPSEVTSLRSLTAQTILQKKTG